MSRRKPRAEHQTLAAGAVCLLIALTVGDFIYRCVGYGDLSLRTVLWVSGFLLSIFFWLKVLLPWQEHRQWMKRLLIAKLGLEVLNLALEMLRIYREFRQNDEPEIAHFLLIVIVPMLLMFLLHPDLHLLRGLLRRKSTERTAGVIILLLAIGYVLMQLTLYVLSVINPYYPIELNYRWLYNILLLLCEAAIYFSWPVLSKPILKNLNIIKVKKMQTITITRTDAPKEKPQDQSKLGFGLYYTDHMFLMNYDEGQGWHDPRIVPYGPIALDPAAMCLHYGQEVFEGMKAYCGVDGQIRLFRPEENMARLNLSNERLCIPLIDEAFAVHAVEELVKVDRDWIPTEDGTSLYIRPYIFATDPHVGVRPAKQLIFAIILSPVGAYYPEGLNPVKIFVEKNYVRAVKGGMGYTKTGGNYASSLKAQEEAHGMGYSQVLWLDGVERKYIEEVGTMNVFFVLGEEIITPALQGSILGGITRKSCIELLRAAGYTVTERALALEEVLAAAKAGELREAFGSGTAAVISPIGALRCGDEVIAINNGEIGEVSQRLYDELTGIQWGKLADTHGWTKVIA